MTFANPHAKAGAHILENVWHCKRHSCKMKRISFVSRAQHETIEALERKESQHRTST